MSPNEYSVVPSDDQPALSELLSELREECSESSDARASTAAVDRLAELLATLETGSQHALGEADSDALVDVTMLRIRRRRSSLRCSKRRVSLALISAALVSTSLRCMRTTKAIPGDRP